MPDTQAAQGIRRAELLASLSLAIDLGLGQPSEWMLKSALVAVRLARAAGYGEATQREAYYLGLIRMLGCTSTAAVDAALFGDETGVPELITADFDDPASFLLLQRLIGQGRPPLARAAMLARFMTAMAEGVFRDNHQRHCEGAAILAGRMGLDAGVQAALRHVYERWDGKGTPNGIAADAIHPAARVVHVAHLTAHYHTLGSIEGAREVAGSRSGKGLDPTLVAVFVANAAAILESPADPMFAAVVDAEPGDKGLLSGDALDQALEAVADFADQKIPQTLGHSRRVAALAEAAARLSGLPQADIDRVRRAALVHDIGRVGVSAAILAKPGKLQAGEWERVRLHPYLTERVFAQAPSLAALGALGGLHHERVDGSGYHRGLAAPMLDAAARILAAANTYAALTEVRPHRPALTAADAARKLRDEAAAGRLDARAADAVITAAGHKPPQVRRAQSVQLSEREIEVLRLVARQHSNKQIARALGISAKTVEHHVSHIFDKAGVATRTGAALYATHNNLL